MARGIGEHLQPTTVLGPGGDAFVPNADAAVKPLFPLVVAAVHALGVSWLDAATLATVVAGAWAVTAVALLVRGWADRPLRGSPRARSSSRARVSPSGRGSQVRTRSPWRSSSAPRSRSRPAGTSRGRPCGARRRDASRDRARRRRSRRPRAARRAQPAATPPRRAGRGHHGLARVRGAPHTRDDQRLAIRLHPAHRLGRPRARDARATRRPSLRRGRVRRAHGSCPSRPTGTGDALAGRPTAPRPRGCRAPHAPPRPRPESRGARRRRRRPPPRGRISGQEPWARPGTSLCSFPPPRCVAGLALAALPGRFRAAGIAVVAGVAALGLLHPVPGSRDYDMFPAVAGGLERRLGDGREPLVTAAPDAYGFWLPEQRVRRMRPGIHGAILLDAAQRLYEPRLTADGRVVARVGGPSPSPPRSRNRH